ncbi:MAG: hypothetical protein JKY18_09790 [Flavobacteriales bacterium]|nr:hypothetical protein [Flavobacteriales bacterium]
MKTLFYAEIMALCEDSKKNVAICLWNPSSSAFFIIVTVIVVTVIAVAKRAVLIPCAWVAGGSLF